jgi:CRP-like cAMP-binding protein
VFVCHPDNRSQIAVVFEGTNAEVAQHLLSGVALATFAQNTASLGASISYHRLRDVIGQLIRAEVIRDPATLRWHESLCSDHQWSHSIATTEILGFDLLESPGDRHRALVADFLTVFGMVLGVLGAWGLFSWLMAGLPVVRSESGRLFTVVGAWFGLTALVRSIGQVIIWMAIGWGLRERIRLRLSIDALGPHLRVSGQWQVGDRTERKILVLFAALSVSVFAAVTFQLRWDLSQPWLVIFSFVLLLIEANPFAASSLSAGLRLVYSRSYQGREESFSQIATLIQRAWVFLYAVVLMLAAALLVQKSHQLVNWDDPVGQLSFLVALVFPAFALLSLGADVLGDLLAPVLGSRDWQVRRLWLRRDRRSPVLVTGAAKSSWERLPLLRSLDPMVRESLLKRATQIQVAKGEAVVRLGDSTRSLYILLDGEAVVRTRAKGGRVRTVARLRAGSVFGEAAFFLGCKRTADVVATEETQLLEIPHHEGLQAIAIDSEKSEELQIRVWLLQALVSNRLFEGLPSEAIDALVFAGRKVQFRPNEVVFRQGEPGDACYIIVQGEVSVVQDGRQINKVGAGEVFGEVSLLKPKDGRTATIVAHNEVIAVRIPAGEFRRSLSLNWNLAIEVERLAAIRLRNDHERRSQAKAAKVVEDGPN